MVDLLTPDDIERLARRAGIPIAEVCRRAGVATSIFARWKAGKTEPNLENYRRIRDVVVNRQDGVSVSTVETKPSVPKAKRSRRKSAVSKPTAKPKAAQSVSASVPQGEAA